MSEISPVQLDAITLLVSGNRYKEVCEQLQIDQSTLWRWRQEPAFAAALEDSRKRIVADAEETLRGLTLRAVETLAAVMVDEDANHAAKVRAAAEVLDRAGLVKIDRVVVSTHDASSDASTIAAAVQAMAAARVPADVIAGWLGDEGDEP